MQPRKSITRMDIVAVENLLLTDSPLSGYLAGSMHGGAAVQRLERVWENTFNRRHAIACNSATAGLFAACSVLGFSCGYSVHVPALSMSATAAAPFILDADLKWLDIDAHGSAEPHPHENSIITSLFGHPPDRRWLQDRRNVILDNSQGLMASDQDGFIETAAPICVTSFNVHKQINCGEGGMISTNDDSWARSLREFINHGEMSPGGWQPGLNLRMTEINAILVLSQMQRMEKTITNLRKLHDKLAVITPDCFKPVLQRPGTRSGCYCYVIRCERRKRDQVVEFLSNNLVPCSAMYQPLYFLQAIKPLDDVICEEAEDLSATGIVFELCAWRYEDELDRIQELLLKASLI